MTGGKRIHKGFTLFEIVVVMAVFGIASLLVISIFTNASASQRREAVSQKALADARLMVSSITQAVQSQRIDYSFYKGTDPLFNGATKVSCTEYPVGDACDLQKPVPVLALIDNQGQKTRYVYHASVGKVFVCQNNPLVSSRDCAPTSTNTNYISITPATLTISKMLVYVSPASDPAFRGTAKKCSALEGGCTCKRISPDGQCGPSTSCDANQGCDGSTSGYCDNGTCAIPDVQPSVTVYLVIESQGLGVGKVSIPLQFTASSRMYDR